MIGGSDWLCVRERKKIGVGKKEAEEKKWEREETEREASQLKEKEDTYYKIELQG